MHLQLSIKADLENVTNLEPASEDFDFSFQVKCTHCQEIHPKYVSMNRIEEWEMSGGKNGKAHFVWKCCNRENSARFESPQVTPYSNQNAQFAPILILECRGLEFTNFDPKGNWTCTGTTGTVFSEVDLKDEWADYDEKTSLPVRVFNVESRWDKVRKHNK